MCIDDKDKYLQGNYNTVNASIIRVYLTKCQGKDYCKSDEEIIEFVKGKFLLFYVNERRFDSSMYGKG